MPKCCEKIKCEEGRVNLLKFAQIFKQNLQHEKSVTGMYNIKKIEQEVRGGKGLSLF